MTTLFMEEDDPAPKGWVIQATDDDGEWGAAFFSQRTQTLTTMPANRTVYATRALAEDAMRTERRFLPDNLFRRAKPNQRFRVVPAD